MDAATQEAEAIARNSVELKANECYLGAPEGRVASFSAALKILTWARVTKDAVERHG